MKKTLIFLTLLLTTFYFANAQRVILNAQQPTDQEFRSGEAYRVINAAFAGVLNNDNPRNIVETPDCLHLPEIFEHIRMMWDNTLEKYVFEFRICVGEVVDFDVVAPSNQQPWAFDPCIPRTIGGQPATDRQRNEIRTDANSPRFLRGYHGDTVTYRWRFWLPPDFVQPVNAFNHIYQVKAVGGDDSQPIFALTVRQHGSIVIRYRESNTTSNTYIAPAIQAHWRGSWIEVEHWMAVGTIENGGWSRMTITCVETGREIHHHDRAITTLRASNNFLRPKWGIYRSMVHQGNNIVSQLRDEAIRFSNFEIQFGADSTIVHPPQVPEPPPTNVQGITTHQAFLVLQNRTTNDLVVSGTPLQSGFHYIDVFTINGVLVQSVRAFLHSDMQQDVEICGAALRSGTYVLRIATANHHETHRIIIH